MRLIDADDLKEKLGDTRDGKPVFRHTEFIRMDVLEEAIDKAPTIKTFTLADIEAQYRNGLEKGLEELKRPHGEWIEKCWNDPRFVDYECSVCKRSIMNGRPNFCPYCGADMRQKEGEAE